MKILNTTVERELKALPAKMRARFIRIVALIEAYGLEMVGMPYVRQIEGKLWELRLRGKQGIGRALYVTVQRKRVVVVRVFAKKSQRTPLREIRLAKERSKTIEQ